MDIIKIINFFTDPKIKGVVALGCVILMQFTPDEIDKLIEGFMAFYGISHLIPKE
ncbi:MAG: hypothetical protein IJT36_09175 [Alphaproteobacteria bacterium]|nr:hypothetical protein [Alphaproteobacteria bacterium]